MAGDIKVLPPLREELDLFTGPSAFDGSPTWSLYDPGNQQYYRIGVLECEVLSYWALGEIKAIVEQLNQDERFTITEDDVLAVYQFLFRHNLLKINGSKARQFLLEQALAQKQHWLSWLIHHYLFFKIPLLRPDRFLKHSYQYIAWLYRPAVLYGLAILLVVNLFVLIDRWDLFTGTLLHFFSFQDFIFYAVAIVFAKIIHELGHAYTAYRYGCRVSSMGVAFLVMFPVLYTDTSDAWKLSSRKLRLAIGVAGILAEIALAIVCTGLWHFLPDGPMRSSVFLLASTTWVMTLLINLNPFMRFDGYYLLSDFLAVENLQQRAFNLGRWKLRSLLFGLKQPLPEVLPARLQKILIIYAWGTWVYRFLLFLGIALLVYHFFFKALGLLLMLVEVIWFIALPIYREISHWLGHKDEISWNKNSVLTAILVLLVLILLAIPWQTRIAAPALLKAGRQAKVFNSLPAQLLEIQVKKGDLVEAGQVLVQLSSSDLEAKIKQSQSKLKALRWQLSFHSQDKQLNQRQQITQGELNSQLSEYKSLLDERDRLQIRATFSGRVIEINEQLSPRQWLAQDAWLLSIAQFEHYKIEAYINEENLGLILPGSRAVFYPEQLDWPTYVCQIVNIDNAASSQIPPLFASRYKGTIPVKTNSGQTLIPETSVYRLVLQAEKNNLPLITRELRGQIMIEVQSESIISQVWKKIVAVLIRESGF